MRAFFFYIDDWLSSKNVRRMDAGEERGYLRLLLHAASEPDCGLPNDRSELADISLLNSQWFKPTQDPNKCFRDQTSGDKILACFFVVRDGQTFSAADNTPITLDPRHPVDISELQTDRLYNQRLLKEFQYQQSHNKQRSDAGKRSAELRGGKFWPPSRQPTTVGPSLGEPLDVSLESSLERERERNANNDVCVCVSVSGSSSEEEEKVERGISQTSPRPQLVPMRKPLQQEVLAEAHSTGAVRNGHRARSPDEEPEPPDLAASTHFEFWLTYCRATGKKVTQVDFTDSLAEWRTLSLADQLAAARYIPAFVKDVGEPPGSRFWKKPQAYLVERLWTAISYAPERKPIRGRRGDEIE